MDYLGQQEWGREGGVIVGTGFLLGLMEMFWNEVMVMTVQHSEYSKNH